VLYKSGVYAWKVLSLTPGGLLCATGGEIWPRVAERRGIDVDRRGEVRRGHIVQTGNEARRAWERLTVWKARTVPSKREEERGRHSRCRVP